MDVAALQARCRTRFQDPDQKIVTNAGWLGYLNDAYQDVINFSPLWPFLMQTSSAVTVAAGVRSASLPSDTYRVASVYNATNQMAMTPFEGHTQHIVRNPDQTVTGPPRQYRIFNNTIQVYPLPDALTTLTLDFFQAPAPMTTAAPVFSTQWHKILVDGALAYAYLDDDNESLASRYQAKFDTSLVAMLRDLLSGQQDRNSQIVDDWNAR